MQVEVRLLACHHACEWGMGDGVATRALGVGLNGVAGRDSGQECEISSREQTELTGLFD